MRQRLLLFVLLLQAVTISVTYGQSSPGPTTGADLQQAIDQRHQMMDQSLLRNYPVRNIGPVIQGGRIVDIEVALPAEHTYYVAYASGGVFKTTNNGISFDPVFDNQGALTIGDIALAPSDPATIYVGTGENNSSRSSYAGSGIYKSTDAGTSWSYLGLGSIQHTGRIIVHPQQPEVLWVAAIGALYSHGPDRGVYKSTDGGQSWEKTLYINDSTGVIDLVIHPQNPDILWAAAWERTRYAWNFKGNGHGTAIYKSTDGGETWTKSMRGLPEGEMRGRIGLDISRSNPDILYAVLDNQAKYDPGEEEAEGLSTKLLLSMSQERFLQLSNEELGAFLKNNGYPAKYTPMAVKAAVEAGDYTVKDVVAYLGDPEQVIDRNDFTGAEVYRSDDGGANWYKTNEYYLERVFYSFGYYFGQIRIDPVNPERIYVHGVPLIVSGNGGKTFALTDSIPGNLHGDQHAMWINPGNPRHMLLGNDGGLYVTYDQGARWLHLNHDPVGQFYTVNVDNEIPYNVYGGLQDNGTMRGSSKTIPGKRGKWEKLPLGCDGMYVAADPRDINTVYMGCQYGFYQKIDLATGERLNATPLASIGEPRERRNWRTPLILSTHNPDIVYFGSQRVWRSMDGAQSWTPISEDLSRNLPQGNVPHSTITALAESPLQFGLLYAGTDDGKLWVSRDGGGSWQDVSTGLPEGIWVSSVFPSPHRQSEVYVALTGYRYDDFETYLFKSTDYGKSWTSLKGDLPKEAVNVLIQDPVAPELLYTGTDHGTYISLNGGANWQHLSGVPNVAAYDLLVHPRDNELVIATHGRSMYIADVKPLQQLVQQDQSDRLSFSKPGNIRYSKTWGQAVAPYIEPDLPALGFAFIVQSGKAAPGTATLNISNKQGETISTYEVSLAADGFHQFHWDLKTTPQKLSRKSKAYPAYVGKGSYEVTISYAGESVTHTFQVL